MPISLRSSRGNLRRIWLRLDAQARNRSWQLALDMHRGVVLAGIIGLAAGIFALFRRTEIGQAEVSTPARQYYDVA